MVARCGSASVERYHRSGSTRVTECAENHYVFTAMQQVILTGGSSAVV